MCVCIGWQYSNCDSDFLFFKANMSYEAMFSWLSLSFGNADKQLASADEVVSFDDVRPD